MAPAETTQVSINGERETLVFGLRYRVRYGKDDAVLVDAKLVERARNGDLVFDELETLADAKRVRVRPSTIDAIFGSGVDEDVLDGEPPVDYSDQRAENVAQRHDGETASAFLARLEATLGASYADWTGSDYGQTILAEAATEDRASRKMKPLATEDVLVDPPKIPKRVAAKILRDAANAVTEEDVPTEPRKGRPYSERNQVWRCGTCKRRTRVPVCTGPADAPHEPVSAPAGKRRDDR